MNFRKSIALITALLMLVSNAGFAMTVHYCGGKIASVSSGFAHQKKSCCAETASTESKLVKDKCCSNKTVHFKAQNADGIVKVFSSEITAPFIVPGFEQVAFRYSSVTELRKTASYYCDAHAPPLFKLYHQYVFYA